MAKQAQANRDWMQTLRWGYRAMLALCILAGGLYAFHETEQFLISDNRFRLESPAEYGMDPPGIRIQGAAYVSRKEILSIFAKDYGKSLYLVPVSKRREECLKLEWVKDATVSRFWPNQILVRIEERVPAALVPAGHNRGWYIDTDGVLLRIPSPSPFRVPVLLGVNSSEEAPSRAERVKRMMRVMREAGRHSDRLTIVDVTDMDNVKVTETFGSRALTLWLGGKNFLSRLDGFERSYPDARRQMPDDTVFDLRIDNRISNVPRSGGEKSGGEKKGD